MISMASFRVAPLPSFLALLVACGSDTSTPADTSTSTSTTDATTSDGDGTTAPDTDDTIETTGATDTTDTGDADTGEVLSPEQAFARLTGDWCAGYAERWCARADDCGCDAAPGFPSAGCEASFTAQCQDGLAQYEAAVMAGEATVDVAAIDRCLSQIGELAITCTLMPGHVFFVSCGILVPPGGFGSLPGDGADCTSAGMCAAGLRCDAGGKCRVPGSDGATCDGPTECAITLSCNEGTCGAPVTDDAGQACATLDACGGETECAASAIKACVAKVEDGPCRFDDDCLATQYCATDTCADLPGDGADCANGASCAAGLGCDLETSKCGALPGDGEPCALGTSGPLLCAEGTTCKDGVCGPIPGKDAPCAQGKPECGPGLGCAFEFEGSFCREPAAAGSDCQNDATCAAGLFCDYNQNKCRASLARGEPCANGNECGDGACLPDATFTFRCADAPGLGDACFIDECGAGLACRTPYTEGACVRRFCGALDF